MNKYMLPGILAMMMCTEAPMALAANGAGIDTASGPSIPVTSAAPGPAPVDGDGNLSGDGGNLPTPSSQPPVGSNPNDAYQPPGTPDGNLTDADDINNGEGDSGDPPTSPYDGDGSDGVDYVGGTTDSGYPGDTDGTDSSLVDNTQMPPDSQPRVEIDNKPPVTVGTIQITRLPYTITHAGQYSVSPKAVYDYLWNQNDLPTARSAMILLDPYKNATSAENGANITIDFNGAVISDCLERCGELRLFMIPRAYSQATHGEHITIKNLTVNRADVDMYNPRYTVIQGSTQYLTLVNVNRGGENLEVMKSDAVYQTAIFNSTVTENGPVPSIDQYRGCLTVSDSRYENKEVVVSDISSDRKCSHHRIVSTMVMESIFHDKLDRPFRITNGYIDNSEFSDIILDMNTSHDFHIGTGNMPIPVNAGESLCTNQCGIIDENGVLHWGFEGNEALWQANKRTE